MSAGPYSIVHVDLAGDQWEVLGPGIADRLVFNGVGACAAAVAVHAALCAAYHAGFVAGVDDEKTHQEKS